MKFMKSAKWFLLGVAVCLTAVMFVVPALASVTQQAELTYRGIKITLNGEEIIPTDVHGNVIEPFIIDGTTYLPVRGIANALGLGVGWDDATNTVVLTSIPNALMRNAYAERSGFFLYVYDGDTMLSKAVFEDVAVRQAIIDELQRVPVVRVSDWTLDDITLPIYGISMGGGIGHSVTAAWSNGYWITRTGHVYRFDFDFEAFIERQSWQRLREQYNLDFTWFPNAVFLTRDADGWRNTLLTPMPELDTPKGIEMALVSNTNDSVTFTLTNSTDEYWMYGAAFALNVLLDGVWYDIPVMPGFGMFTGVGFLLNPGLTRTYTYNLATYGKLPPGTYRLLKEQVYVVFEVK